MRCSKIIEQKGIRKRMENPLLSVIIPIYNAQDYIENLLSDIQRQTFADFEVLLIDDGSVDQSAVGCQKYVTLDQRFCYCYQENQGVSAARNQGIERAEGEYIIFLDADDRIPKDCFEKRIHPLQTLQGIDLVIGKYLAIRDFEEDEELFWQSDFSGQKNYEAMIFDCVQAAISFYYGVVWNKVYRKDIITRNRIRFDESLRWCEDFIFNMDYFRFVKKCYYLADSTYYYCYRLNSALSQDEIIDDRMDFIRYRYLDRLGEAIGDETVKTAYKKKSVLFLIHRIHGISSERAKGWKLSDRNGYREWKEYLCTNESVMVWKEKGIFSDLTTAEKIVWLLMKIRLYGFIYIYYFMKSLIKMRNGR